jgi:hypothetical protein
VGPRGFGICLYSIQNVLILMADDIEKYCSVSGSDFKSLALLNGSSLNVDDLVADIKQG